MAEEPTVVRVIRGTPPSPEDPYPSNQTITEYSDESCWIETGPPDAEMLAEYVAALTEHPDHSGLHLHYGIALQVAGRLDDALAQFREAVRLDPASFFAHSMLADALGATASTAEAVTECREALRLFHLESDGSPSQQEAALRWGLANALHQDDREQEALGELQAAVRIQRAAVAADAGSPTLLGQLERQLAEWNGAHA